MHARDADLVRGWPDRFELDVPGGDVRRLAVGWLLLALGSLVVGGLLTVLIVLSRVPYVQDFFPLVDWFRTALVVHVDLTVLVWFLAIAAMLWTINSTTGCWRCAWSALILCASGAATISISPFLADGVPLMTNYVPVLDDPLFLGGLGVFGLGVLIVVLRGLLYSRPTGVMISGEGALRFGLYTALIAALFSFGALAASWAGLPRTLDAERYFELLFWGPGHALQFVHVQLMLVSWLWLAGVSGITSRLTPRIVLFLFAVGLIPVLLTPLAYLNFSVESGAHQHTMTWLMRVGGGLAAVPIGLVILFNLAASWRTRPPGTATLSALLSSMVLFGAGGLVGFMIQGSDVTVPAHYHGSIVAVTLAYMGVTYHLLPRLGFREPRGRLVRWQPWLYAGGQLLHVSGLAWSGGYGVQRKTAGEAQALDALEKVAGMGLMGLGGLIAVIGGVLFLVITLSAIWPRRPERKRRSAPSLRNRHV